MGPQPAIQRLRRYRYLYVDYDRDNFLYRVSIHGPLIGTTFRFLKAVP